LAQEPLPFSPPTARLYSIGYEGLTPDELVRHLQSLGVTLVVDVRYNPVSRKPGFSRRALEKRLPESGITYRHEQTLGNPPDIRAVFTAGAVEEAAGRLRAVLDDIGATALERLADDARTTRVAVLCLERASVRCHRRIVTDRLRELYPDIDVADVL